MLKFVIVSDNLSPLTSSQAFKRVFCRFIEYLLIDRGSLGWDQGEHTMKATTVTKLLAHLRSHLLLQAPYSPDLARISGLWERTGEFRCVCPLFHSHVIIHCCLGLLTSLQIRKRILTSLEGVFEEPTTKAEPMMTCDLVCLYTWHMEQQKLHQAAGSVCDDTLIVRDFGAIGLALLLGLRACQVQALTVGDIRVLHDEVLTDADGTYRSARILVSVRKVCCVTFFFFLFGYVSRITLLTHISNSHRSRPRLALASTLPSGAALMGTPATFATLLACC
jgi:hypothetical protein